MRGKGVAAAVMAAVLVFPCAAGAQEPNQVTGLTATQDIGFTTLKWNPVAGATDYQIERTPVDANDTPTAAATIVGVWQPQRTITPDNADASRSRATPSAAATRGGCGRASGRARARAAAVLGAGDRDHARDRSRARRDRLAPDGLGGANDERLHDRRRGGHVHGRARRGQRPHAGGRAGAHAREPADEPVDHRLPEAAGDGGGDLGQADLRDQLQRARQRGLRPRVVLHDGPPARVHRGPGDPGDADAR